MLFPSADKKAKKDKPKVGQKKQQKAKKGSDADSDVSSGEDGSPGFQGNGSLIWQLVVVRGWDFLNLQP